MYFPNSKHLSKYTFFKKVIVFLTGLLLINACTKPNTAPTISALTPSQNLVFIENISEGNEQTFSLGFSVSDKEDLAETLKVSAESSNSERLEPKTLSISCALGNCTLTGIVSRARAAEIVLKVTLTDTQKAQTSAQITIKIEPRLIKDVSMSALSDTATSAEKGDVLAFESSLFEIPRAIIFSEPWLISKDLGLRGPSFDKLFFDAQGKTRLFQVEAGVTFMLEGIHLWNGEAPDDAVQGSFEPLGGAIFNRGKLILRNSRISRSHATKGGAIYNFGEDALVLVEDSLLGGQAASNGNSAVRSGGAIFNELGTVGISNSELSFNSSVERAGGVFNLGESALITVDNSRFLNNISQDGGAIKSEFGTIIIQNSSLIANNIATTVEGGALFNTSGVIEIYNSTLKNNEATIGAGGGIYSFQCDPDFSPSDACTLQNKDAKVLIDASTLESNRAVTGGGAIANETGGQLVIQNGSVLTKNSTQRSGGAVFSIGPTSLSEDSSLTNNVADSDGDGNGKGGGMFLVGDATTIAQSAISSNLPDDFATPDALTQALYLKFGLKMIQIPTD